MSLVPWLDDHISSQLHMLNSWLNKQQAQRQSGEKDTAREWASLYDDNGSCVFAFDEIPDKTSNSNVLIIKSSAQNSPLVLTDGSVVIQAALSSACRKQLATRFPGLPLSSPTTHSVIAVRKYTLRYTPYGPSRDRLAFTLDLVDWQRERRREAAPGVLVPLSSCSNIIDALEVLQRTRAETDRQCFRPDMEAEQLDNMAPRRQEAEDVDHGDVSPGTQMAYGTQMVHRLRTPSNAMDAPGFNNLDPTPGRNRTPTGPPSDTTSKLLGLLKFPGAHSVPRQDPPAGPPNAPSAGGFARTSKNRASNEGLERSASTMRPTLMPPRYPQSNPVDKSPQDARVSTLQNVDDRASASAIRRNSRKQRSLDEEARTKQRPSIDQSSGGVATSHIDVDDMEEAVPEWLKDSCRMDNCGNVSARQRSLLMRLDSWQKPAVGNRFPDANLPHEILEALKDFDNGPATSDTESSEEEDADDPVFGEKGILSNAEGDVEMDDETHSQTSKITWSRSPSPEPPKQPFRPGLCLPPDSSLEGSKNMDVQSTPRQESSGQEAQRPVVIESSNEETMIDPPSSPPLARDEHDSDLDMELEVPRGLGEDSAMHNVTSTHASVRPPTMVLVKETPYTKGKNVGSADSPGQVRQQNSSGRSKDTASTSVIPCTYNEPNSSGNASSNGVEVTLSSTAAARAMPDAHLHFANDGVADVEPGDIYMEDAPSESPRRSNGSGTHLDTERLSTKGHAPPQPRPNPAQIPRTEACRFEDQIPPTTEHHQSVSAYLDMDNLEIGANHTKRKLEKSPSKKSNRQSKRRQIKLTGFGESSPVKDLADQLERDRRESMEKFIQSKQAKSHVEFASDNSTQGGAEARHSPLPHKLSFTDDNPPTISRSRPTPEARKKRQGSPPVNDGHDATRFTTSNMAEGQQKEAFSQMKPVFHPKSVKVPTHKPSADYLFLSGASAQRGQQHFDTDKGTDTFELDGVLRSPIPLVRDSVVSSPEPSRSEARDDYEMYVDDTLVDDQIRRRTPAMSPRPLEKTTAPRSKPATVFQLFKDTYPEYSGDTRHFLGQCRQMKKLDLEDKMVPKWQWDDFIIRNRIDYKAYVNQCIDNGEDAEPYFRFYKDTIRDTVYTKGIIVSRQTLVIAIDELEGKALVVEAPAAKARAVEVRTVEARAVEARAVDARAVDAPAPQSTPVSFARKRATRAPTPKRAMKVLATSEVAPEQPHVAQDMPKKTRHSLPSAFGKAGERAASVPRRPVVDPPRHSLPASSSMQLPSTLPSRPTNLSTPMKQPSRRSTATVASSRPSASARTSSGLRVPTEPTGDIYRDFVFAQARVTSWTASTRVDPDPDVRFPENLHVRPVAQVKRKGYDLLEWTDHL